MSRRLTDADPRRALRVLVAPDSFKGSATATEVAGALADGWARQRPRDEVLVLPQADGGEGTAAAIEASVAQARWRTGPLVTGPDGDPVSGRWLALADGTAVIELAQICGLPMLRRPDPVGASTRGLGETIRAAVESGAPRVCVTLGGSASTDGGAGALCGLGARLLDRHNRHLTDGGLALAELDHIDITGLIAPPPGGVELLTDTRAVLTGPNGAASVFGPQKGASPTQIAALDTALDHFAEMLAQVLPVDAAQPGAGAAGGTGFGLGAWGGCLVEGASRIAELTGLTRALPECDVVVTGEGCYDHTSATGKLVGFVLGRARENGLRTAVVAGRLAETPPDLGLDLTVLAGSAQDAMTDPLRWLRQAATTAARRLDQPSHAHDRSDEQPAPTRT
ncbi:glycerate kinase [Saccharopolyspora erythraea]|uniref:glycerate kinase n=1 Tax=Saccharopolyspora erythraea TaxID=1836 RepID=UPI001BAD854A|nr:glycerate kinase [Saccharopolyspora erythraea]QUH04193.1 glycerate kinase [Saccharopolyspora erythraea]